MIITKLKIKIRSHRINMEDREKDKLLEESNYISDNLVRPSLSVIDFYKVDNFSFAFL